MRKHLFLILMAIAVSAFVFSASPSQALHKNYDNQLACGSCHTMHNSQGGAKFDGSSGQSIVLLRAGGGGITNRAAIHNLCLQCHASDGTQNIDTWGADSHTAPKVYISGSSGCGITTGGGTYCTSAGIAIRIGAGGDFGLTLTAVGSGWGVSTAEGGTALGYGHSLGATAVDPPGFSTGQGGITTFSCTNCHDPHGAYNAATSVANRYRNLRIAPPGSAGGMNAETVPTLNTGIRSYVGFGGCAGAGDWISGQSGGTNATAIWPIYRTGADLNATGTDTSDCASAGGEINSYSVDEPGTNGIANWCAACHDNWHEDNGVEANGESSNDWMRHPVDQRLEVAGSTTSGGGVDIIDIANYGATGDGTKLPVATSGAGTARYYITDTATDKVFCLSCHFAHAGPYEDSLRWDYIVAGSVTAGDQIGESMASNVGCQKCHNR